MAVARAPAPVGAGADLKDGLRRGLLAGAAVLAVVIPPSGWLGQVGAVHAPGPSLSRSVRVVDFGDTTPSPDVRDLADWIASTRDNGNADFVLVDKKFAAVHVFDAQARLLGSTPVLLGAAPGDDSVVGIGSRPISEVRPEERTTPAGRFIGERGRNAIGEDVVWVDYGAAVSMHRVRLTNPKEHRLERLASPRVEDRRISYGCINVPVAFFEATLSPLFAHRRAIVYVLPEVKPVREVFDLSRQLAATSP